MQLCWHWKTSTDPKEKSWESHESGQLRELSAKMPNAEWQNTF